jgi:DNA-binding protein H-NS
MENNELKSMSSDELWKLYEDVAAELAGKIATEKATLEERLRRIQSVARVTRLGVRRRPYPRVLPKYQNPKNPAETWSGRGKQPRWVKGQLLAGKKLDRFLIAGQSIQKEHRALVRPH